MRCDLFMWRLLVNLAFLFQLIFYSSFFLIIRRAGVDFVPQIKVVVNDLKCRGAYSTIARTLRLFVNHFAKKFISKFAYANQVMSGDI